MGREKCQEDGAQRGAGHSSGGRGTAAGGRGTVVGKRQRRGGTKSRDNRRDRERKSHISPHPTRYGSVGQGVSPASTCCLRCLHRNATSCRTCTTGFGSQFHSDPGPDLRGTSLRPVNRAHYVSPPPILPQSSFPTSQQPQQLNNGAVWLQTLRLHRAELEAPTQHSCP